MDADIFYFLMVAFFALALGAITAKVAADRSAPGNPFFWFIAGTFLAIIALPLAIFCNPDARALENKSLAGGDSKKCPRCAELVKREAVVCRFCNHSFSPARR